MEKKDRIICLIFGAILVGVIVLGFGLWYYASNQVDKANALVDEDRFLEAYMILENSAVQDTDVNNTKDKIFHIVYQEGIYSTRKAYMECGEYRKAVQEFSSIPEYKDSKYLVEDCLENIN